MYRISTKLHDYVYADGSDIRVYNVCPQYSAVQQRHETDSRKYIIYYLYTCAFLLRVHIHGKKSNDIKIATEYMLCKPYIGLTPVHI